MKIPAFDLKISKVWAVAVIAWTILVVLLTSYINFRINEYKVQHEIKTLGSAFENRKPVVDGQLTGLRTDVGALQKDVQDLNAKFDTSSKVQEKVNEQMLNNQQEMKLAITTLTNAIIQKGRTASEETVNAVLPVRYGVMN